MHRHHLSRPARHEIRSLIAVCSAGRAGVATAPCFFQVQLPAGDAAGTVEIQVTPAGAFKPSDSRPMPVPAWHIDAAIAAKVIERFRARKTPSVLDYEHQTLLAEDNGLPAPAAGWLKDLEWRDGVGLVARYELTARARQYVADGEYRYYSPVFLFDERTGDVLELLMGALTNHPAIDGMAPVALRAAARFATHPEETTMNKLLLAVCTMLGLSTTATTEDEAIAALKAHQAKPDPLKKIREDLGLAEDIGAAEISTAVVALKSKAAAADPSKVVPIAVVEELQTRVAALTASQVNNEVEQLVSAGLADGRILGSMADWARELGKKDVAQLKAYLDKAQPIAALKGTQTDGKDPGAGESSVKGLTQGELAVCKATGVSPEDFLKSKAVTA